jgi:hypothetical protein
MESKAERIEEINIVIVAHMLDRARARRFNDLLKEQEITDEINKLELEIKAIRAEGYDVHE